MEEISGIKIIPSLFISPEKHFFSDHQRRGNSLRKPIQNNYHF